MSVKTNNIKLNLKKEGIEQNIEKWIEQDIIVPDNMPDALRIISVASIPYINDIEINSGRVKIVGKICYLVIYRANDDKMSIRGLNVSYPYTVNIENEYIKDKECTNINTHLKNIIYSLPNERKIAIKNEVTFNIKVDENVNVDVIKEFPKDENIECIKNKKIFSNIKAKKKLYISSSEDVMLSKSASPVYEILKYNYKIKDTEYKESYNKIMLKGVIELDLMYVGEENGICREKIDVPFSSMIEFNNISDKSKFKIEYFLRDLNVKINPDIDQKTLNVDYKIENITTMYEDEEIEYVDDFYSRTRDLKYDVKEMNISSDNYSTIKEINITDTIGDIIPDGYKIVEYDLDTSNVSSMFSEDNIIVSGIAKLNVMIQNKENGEIESKTIEIMVDQKFSIEDKWKNKYLNIKIKDKKLNVIQTGNSIDIKVTIILDIETHSVFKLSSVNNIEETPLNLNNISSINIYVVKKGDSVWKIAKKYKTSMGNIIKTNKLENPDYIEVGQKLLVIR